MGSGLMSASPCWFELSDCPDSAGDRKGGDGSRPSALHSPGKQLPLQPCGHLLSPSLPEQPREARRKRIAAAVVRPPCRLQGAGQHLWPLPLDASSTPVVTTPQGGEMPGAQREPGSSHLGCRPRPQEPGSGLRTAGCHIILGNRVGIVDEIKLR